MASRKKCRVLRLETPQPASGASQRRGQQGWAPAGRAAKGTDTVSFTATLERFPFSGADLSTGCIAQCAATDWRVITDLV